MVKIITDTTAGLPKEAIQKYHLTVIPQVLHFGEESYLEEVEMDRATFMARLKRSRELPKTAAPPPELFIQEFQRLVPQGEPILCIHPSSEVSGTIRSATVAASDFLEADIRVMDTRVVASPLATMVLLAAEWAQEGMAVDSIETRLRTMIPHWHVYFMVDTLEYLVKGGRIGGAAALLGSVLRIKPILTLRDGRVDQFEKERTHKRALSRLKALVQEQMSPSQGHLSVMHADVLEQGKDLAEDLRALLGLQEVPVYDIPPAVVVHAGPGLLGVAFQED